MLSAVATEGPVDPPVDVAAVFVCLASAAVILCHDAVSEVQKLATKSIASSSYLILLFNSGNFFFKVKQRVSKCRKLAFRCTGT